MGPLKGIKIIEMAGIGPGPFCGMVLADLGAEVIRVDRGSAKGTGSRQEASNRGKKSIAVNVTIQSMDKTLSEKDLNEVSQKIVNTVKDKTGATLRS